MDEAKQNPFFGWISPTDFANKEGLTVDAVYRRMNKKKYRPHIKKFDGKWHLNPIAFRVLINNKLQPDTAEVTKQDMARGKESDYGQKIKPPESKKTSYDMEVIDYLEEKRKWSARFEELKYKKHLKEIVSSKSVAHEAATIARLARDQLLQIPDRVSGQLINVSSTDAVFAVINGEINRVLIELTRAIEKIDVPDAVTLDSDPESFGRVPPTPLEESIIEGPGYGDEDDDENPYDIEDDGDEDNPYFNPEF